MEELAIKTKHVKLRKMESEKNNKWDGLWENLEILNTYGFDAQICRDLLEPFCNAYLTDRLQDEALQTSDEAFQDNLKALFSGPITSIFQNSQFTAHFETDEYAWKICEVLCKNLFFRDSDPEKLFMKLETLFSIFAEAIHAEYLACFSSKSSQKRYLPSLIPDAEQIKFFITSVNGNVHYVILSENYFLNPGNISLN